VGVGGLPRRKKPDYKKPWTRGKEMGDEIFSLFGEGSEEKKGDFSELQKRRRARVQSKPFERKKKKGKLQNSKKRGEDGKERNVGVTKGGGAKERGGGEKSSTKRKKGKSQTVAGAGSSLGGKDQY